MPAGAHLLIVEGVDDEKVIGALFKAHAITNWEIRASKGIERMIATLETQLKSFDHSLFGIVVDADQDQQGRWQSVRSVLEKFGCLDLPKTASPAGTIAKKPDGTKVGVWIMPDNTTPGMLEDFLHRLGPPEDPLWGHVNTFIDTIPPQHAKCPPHRITKARVHAWLSVQEEPGKPLGVAITARYLDATSPATEPFLQWIRNLMVD